MEKHYNDFEKLANLGSGSYGSVELLRHKKTNRLIAGKFFHFTRGQETKRVKNDAENEAQILARISHPNILCFVGITYKGDCFGILSEYICCGNLENLLLHGTDTWLSWKVRSRFFIEIANALDYLHFGNPKVSYVHGDLKPQNILLTESLTIKLADFGAATIAKQTGTLSVSITMNENTQHTELYTAPEFLRSPSKQKTCSMDVYSYGMVGYEIITRKQIYGESSVPHGVLMTLIRENGQKPDKACIEASAEDLVEGSSEYKIYMELKKLVNRCWQFDASQRPKMTVVKEELGKLAHETEIYDATTNEETRSLVARRKLTFHNQLAWNITNEFAEPLVEKGKRNYNRFPESQDLYEVATSVFEMGSLNSNSSSEIEPSKTAVSLFQNETIVSEFYLELEDYKQNTSFHLLGLKIASNLKGFVCSKAMFIAILAVVLVVGLCIYVSIFIQETVVPLLL